MSDQPVESIAQQLRRVHEEVLQADDAEFATVANNNVVIVASSETPQSKLQDVISAFAEAHPSRFFVITTDDNKTQLETRVSAMCHSLGGKQKVCSEVIACALPPKLIQLLPSLIQAHQLSGRLTELCIVDQSVPSKLFLPLAHSSDIVYLDSKDLYGRLEGVHQVYQQAPRVVDLEWMRLSLWRDAIKAAFDKPQLLGLAASIAKISLKFPKDGSDLVSNSSLLLAGWFLTRLGGEVRSVKNGAVTFQGNSGISTVMSFECPVSGKNGSTGQVFIEFNGPGAITLSITLDEAGILRTESTTNPPVHTSLPMVVEDQRMLLIKHFLIGESVSNYWNSLSSAIQIVDRLKDQR